MEGEWKRIFAVAVWALLGSGLFIGRGSFNLYGQQAKPARPAVTPKKTVPAKPPVYVPVEQNGKWGYKDNDSGKIVVTPQLDDAWIFTEGLAAVKVGAKWGFIDMTRNYVVEPAFDNVSIFSEGLARVRIGRQWGFIDKTGRMVIAPRFNSTSDFSEGLAWVMYEFGPGPFLLMATGFINKSGTVVLTNEKDKTIMYAGGRFSEGLAIVGNGGQGPIKYGYCDKNGQIVIPIQFEICGDFSKGLAPATKNGKKGFVYRSGQFVINSEKENH